MTLPVRGQPRDEGYGRSDVKEFVIGSGADGSAVAAVDLVRNYMFLLIVCEDAAGIDALTSLSAEVTYDTGDDLVPLYELNDPATLWSRGDIPESGSFAFALTHAIGAQEIRLVLDVVATAEVTFKIYGIGGGIEVQ